MLFSGPHGRKRCTIWISAPTSFLGSHFGPSAHLWTAVEVLLATYVLVDQDRFGQRRVIREPWRGGLRVGANCPYMFRIAYRCTVSKVLDIPVHSEVP